MKNVKENKHNAYVGMVNKHPNILIEESELYDKKGKWSDYFGNTNDINLEIGTGLGNFFSSEVIEKTDQNHIGMEIRFKRLIKTAEKSLVHQAKNFVLLKEMGQKVAELFGEGEISKTYIFFPDPWANKDRQLKNRLFQEKFIQNLAIVTKKGGSVIFKTDHREYFDTTLELFAENPSFEEKIKSYNYEEELEHFDKNNMTEFEHIFREKSIKINYVEYLKK